MSDLPLPDDLVARVVPAWMTTCGAVCTPAQWVTHQRACETCGQVEF